MGKTTAISPEEYRKCLQDIELTNISLISSDFSVKRELLENSMDIFTGDKVTYKILDNTTVLFKQTFDLTVAKEDSKDSKEIAVKLKCCYEVLFHYQCDSNKEFFDIYKDINLSLNTWPYFREHVSNLFHKACLPPFTLPLLKR